MRTRIFRMSHAAFAKKIVGLYGLPYLAALSILTVLGIVAGIVFDLRYLILALIVVFIISPAALSMLYYAQGLKRLTCLNVIAHSLSAGDDGIELVTYNQDEEPERNIIISYDSLGKLNIGTDSVTFLLKNNDDGFLWIPMSAFDSPEEFGDFVNSAIKTDKTDKTI